MTKEIWIKKMTNLFSRRSKGNSSSSDRKIGDYYSHVRKCHIGQTVLDVGCGSMHLKTVLPESIKYFGIDAFPVDDSVIEAEIETYKPTESIDTVYCFAVLDGVHDIRQALDNIKRIADKNVVILTGIDIEPDNCHTFKITEQLLGLSFDGWKVGHKEYLAPKVLLIEYRK